MIKGVFLASRWLVYVIVLLVVLLLIGVVGRKRK